jgi:hypothetical protein
VSVARISSPGALQKQVSAALQKVLVLEEAMELLMVQMARGRDRTKQDGSLVIDD